MLGAGGMSVTLICQVPRKPNLNLSMTALKQRKTIVLALALIIVSITGIIGLGIPRVHALGTGTGGIALSAQNCGTQGATCPTGFVRQTDTTLFGTGTVKIDGAIKFVNTTNTQAEKWSAPKAIVRDPNGNGLYDTGEAVLYGTAPTVGTKLSCNISPTKSCAASTAGTRDPTINRFIGPGATWASGNTAFQDSGPQNTLYDWGEFVYTGPVPTSSATETHSFAVGILMNATAGGPINGVYGWQVIINYDPNFITPSAVPNPASAIPDAGFNVVDFGQSSAINWDGLISAKQGFGGFIVAENKAIHEGNITVFFTKLSPNPADNILSKNVLATVYFGLVAQPISPLSLTLSGIKFVDQNTNTIPGPF